MHYFYNKIALFCYNENEFYNLDDIIFINYINKNHYQLLKPNEEFIFNRITNNKIIEYDFIYFDRIKNSILDCKDNEIEDTKDTKAKRKIDEKNKKIIWKIKK